MSSISRWFETEDRGVSRCAMVPGSADYIEYGNRPITGYGVQWRECLRMLSDGFARLRMPSAPERGSYELSPNALTIMPSICTIARIGVSELFVASERYPNANAVWTTLNGRSADPEGLKRILHIAVHTM